MLYVVFCLCIFPLRLSSPACAQSCTNTYLNSSLINDAFSVPIPSTWDSTAKHYIWFQLAVCGVECPITTFRVLYRKSGAPDYQVIVSTTSQLSHNISALQPNTLYNIVVEATHTALQDKVNSSVTRAYTTPQGELEGVHAHIYFVVITLK